MASVTPVMQDNVTELYLVFFGRAPDAAGFGFWAQALANGATPQELADAFQDSPEFISQYDGLTNTEVVARLYNNILNRNPDVAGWEFWVDALDNGVPLAQVAWSIVDSAFEQGTSTDDGKLIHNKVEVGNYFAMVLASNDKAVAETAYNGVTKDHATVTAAELRLYEMTQQTGAYNLTPETDTVLPTHGPVDLVKGVLGSEYKDRTDVGTFTLNDTIYGNGSTKVELTVNSAAPDVAPRVNMSGVDHLAFVAAADETSVELNAGTYGRDVSKVSATGASSTNIDVTSLVTEDSFNMTTSPTFGGELVVGNAQFDNGATEGNPLGRMVLASPNTLAGQGDTGYVGGNMVSDLYSENGVKANLYIASGENAGGSSINLTEGEIEVNAGAGRGSRANYGDEVGAHVFHYVNATDDLVTADNISVDLVDINVAKGSEGEVVISNWADKTTDLGDAQALGVDVGSVDINIADGSAAIFEVRNMASNTALGDTTSANPEAYAGDVTVGTIDSLALTGSDVALKVLQLASLDGEDSLFDGATATAQAGDVTVGDVTTVGVLANSVSLEVVNKAELRADYVPPAVPPIGDYTGIVGNLEVGDVTMSGTNYGADVTLQNIIEFGNLAAGTGVANSTVGNTLVGDLNIQDNYEVTVLVQDGNEDADAAQGSITVGTMNVGSVDVAAGNRADVTVDRNAIADDEDAAIGVTNIAVAGTVSVSGDAHASVDLNVLASATTTGDTDVAQVTVGNIETASNADAEVNVNVQALSAVKTNGSVAADVAGVNLGNISANVDSATAISGLAKIDIAVEAQVTPAVGATGYADTATVGDVTIASLTAFATESGAAPLADAMVSVVVDANSNRGDATVGDVTLGYIFAAGRDVAQATVTVSASADIAGNASVGDVTIGSVVVSNGLGGVSTIDAQFNLLVDADASTSADVGGHTATVSSVTVGNVDVRAIGAIAGSDTAPDALIDIQVEAEADGGAASANQATVTAVDLGTLTAVASNIEDNSDAIIGVHVMATASGDATVDGVLIDDITATAEGVAAAFIDQSATANVTGDATVANVLVGDIVVTGETTTTLTSVNADAVAWAEAVANANVGNALVDDVAIGDITATGVNVVNVSVDRNAAAITGDATVDHIIVGDIVANVSATSLSEAIVVNTITAQTGGAPVVGDLVDVPAFNTAGDATVRYVDLGTVNASGASVVAAQVVTAFVGSDTEGYVAEVRNVDVADITVTDLGVGTVTPLPAPADVAVAAVQVTATSYTQAIAVNKGEAYIRELTIGNMTAEAAEGVNDGIVGISVAVSASADHVGNVDDVTMGNLSITVNDSAEVALRVDVNANADKLFGADGNVGVATIGNINVIGGELVTDYAGPDTLSDNDVLDIVALDDIGTVTIGNWNIEVGAGSVLDEQNAVIAAGSGGSGFIESVTVGNITRTATGTETVINSDIHIEADQQIQAVTIGSVTNTADGDAAKVAQAIHIGTGMGHGLEARPQAIGDIVIGNLTANATGAGVETASGTVSTTASIDVLISSSGDVESVTVGNIAASAEGFYAATHVAVQVNATEDVGPVVVGSLALDVSGTTATGDINIGVSGVIRAHPVPGTPSFTYTTDMPTSIESLTVGDVTMNVFGDSASGTVDIQATADASPVIDGVVTIGDLSITLGNDASARTPLPTYTTITGTTSTSATLTLTSTVDAIANFTANATVGGDLTIGNINLTAQASVEDQLNSAGVQAHVNLTNGSLGADVNIGDITVVGGYYAKSGVTGATATTSGDLNGAITSYLAPVVPGDVDVQGGQTLYTQSALSYEFLYDQATGKWSMTGANVEAALTDFSFTQGTGADSNVWTLSGTVSTAGESELLTVTFDPDANTVSYDWLAGPGIPTAWSDQTDGVATVSFDGALNNGDAISFSLANGGVFGPTDPQPAPLELLDNFNILNLDDEASWLQASVLTTTLTTDVEGAVYIGDIDYSGYLPTPADSGNTTYTADEVTIDISGFGVSAGVQTIKFAQMATNVVDNAGTQAFDFNSAGADTLTIVAQNHVLQAAIDTAQDFVDGSDTITLQTAGAASGTVMTDTAGTNYDTFVANAAAYLVGGAAQDLAFVVTGGNTYVAYLSTSTGVDALTNMNVVQITGVSLAADDFTVAANDWVIS